MPRRAKPAKVNVRSKAARGTTKSASPRVRDLAKRLAEALKREAEALEQQTATSEILRVISSSPADARPVFEAIVRSASRLCGGEWAIVTRYDGELLHLAAQHNPRFGAADAASRFFPQVPRRETSITARALVDSAVVHVSDVETEDLDLSAREQYRRIGLRAVLAVPMVHEGRPIGVVAVSRGAPVLFSDRQVDLLQTFADQAVIAIENVRLFTELEARNRDLTDALEQQTATSEILRVISSSPTEVQPVFEAIAQSAMRLCDGTMSVVSRYDGEVIHLGAYTHVSTEGIELIIRRFPMYPTRDNLHGRVVLEGGVVHIPDVQADAEFDPAISQALRSRSTLGVPMLRDGRVLGAIAVARSEVRPFTDAQIALLKTFADQAVIAIENVRLFNETKEALDQQTATSEILRVISSSPTDVKPVFDTIAESAVRLCDAAFGAV